jgi:class 3 adenylate cyclase
MSASLGTLTVAEVLDPSIAEQARAALMRHEWRAAYELLTGADAADRLGAAELELLAQASWWIGKLPQAIEARERAYAEASKAGEIELATRVAILLARDNAFRNNDAMSGAWLARAERLLAQAPENLGHGWLATIRAFRNGQHNRVADALVDTTRALEIARRFGDRELETLALSCHGLMLTYDGQIEAGLAALDEATAPAVAGELEPQIAGGVCCTTISAAAALGDWQRAAQWTEAQDRWCRREHINGFPGMCRLYRAEIKRLRGAWLEAEAEARRATDELAGYVPAAVGIALYEIGLIRLRLGDLAGAEDALLRAHAYNRDPEPALSLVRLAEGNTAAATASIARALDDPPAAPTWATPLGSDLGRLALLPAQAEIALAAGDVALARKAVDEVSRLAARFPSVMSSATAATADGSVLVAEGRAHEAITTLRRAVQLWGELDAPYDAARARVSLAEALLADGSPDGAALEVRAARTVFERLGAQPDLVHADSVIAGMQSESGVRPLAVATDRVLRTFGFTDIVDSTKLAELLGDAAWRDLIRWHDQTLRTIVATHGGEVIKAIGDGLFVAFDDPDRALEAAVDIQRRLVEQRAGQGFAPSVRIGLHRAEADRGGMDYMGTGVNTAARVSSAAAGGEILVSASTIASTRRTFAESGRRTVALKGLAAPVEVVAIDWR